MQLSIAMNIYHDEQVIVYTKKFLFYFDHTSHALFCLEYTKQLYS